jgi:hypothetical protein
VCEKKKKINKKDEKNERNLEGKKWEKKLVSWF